MYIRIPIEPSRSSSWNVTIVGERNHCSHGKHNPLLDFVSGQRDEFGSEAPHTGAVYNNSSPLWKVTGWNRQSFLSFWEFGRPFQWRAVKLPGRSGLFPRICLLRNVRLLEVFDMESQDESFIKRNHRFEEFSFWFHIHGCWRNFDKWILN